jgi:hypothetical protein
VPPSVSEPCAQAHDDRGAPLRASPLSSRDELQRGVHEALAAEVGVPTLAATSTAEGLRGMFTTRDPSTSHLTRNAAGSIALSE